MGENPLHPQFMPEAATFFHTDDMPQRNRCLSCRFLGQGFHEVQGFCSVPNQANSAGCLDEFPDKELNLGQLCVAVEIGRRLDSSSALT